MKRLTEEVKKPWGAYYDMACSEQGRTAEEKGKWHLKVIEVKQGQRLSLQKHKNRSEFWIIAEGEARVQKGEEVLKLKPGDTVTFEKEELHRLEGITNVTFVEVSFGDHDENDITRVSDDYGR